MALRGLGVPPKPPGTLALCGQRLRKCSGRAYNTLYSETLHLSPTQKISYQTIMRSTKSKDFMINSKGGMGVAYSAPSGRKKVSSNGHDIETGTSQYWVATIHPEEERETTFLQAKTLRELVSNGGTIDQAMSQEYTFNHRLGNLLNLIYDELPELNDGDAWQTINAFFPYGLPWKGKPEMIISRCRLLAAGRVVLDFELDPEEDGLLHFHMLIYSPGNNQRGVTHTVASMLMRPFKGTNGGWVKKLQFGTGRQFAALSAYLDYITKETKEGKFFGNKTWGKDFPLCVKAKMNNSISSAKGSAVGSDILLVRDRILDGSIRSAEDAYALWGTEITKIAAIEKSFQRSGALQTLVDVENKKRMRAVYGMERLVITVHGPSGVGKDRWAKYYFARKYIEENFPCKEHLLCQCDCFLDHIYEKTGPTQWWGGYLPRHYVVIFTDVELSADSKDRNKWCYTEILRLCDRIDPSYSVEAKGTEYVLVARVLVFTMASSLYQAMPTGPDGRLSWDQLIRRINLQILLTSRPHADPIEWTFKRESYNAPTPNDTRNLVKLVDMSKTTCEEHAVPEGEEPMEKSVSALINYFPRSVIDLTSLTPVSRSPGSDVASGSALPPAPKKVKLSLKYADRQPPAMLGKRVLQPFSSGEEISFTTPEGSTYGSDSDVGPSDSEEDILFPPTLRRQRAKFRIIDETDDEDGEGTDGAGISTLTCTKCGAVLPDGVTLSLCGGETCIEDVKDPEEFQEFD